MREAAEGRPCFVEAAGGRLPSCYASMSLSGYVAMELYGFLATWPCGHVPPHLLLATYPLLSTKSATVPLGSSGVFGPLVHVQIF